MQKAQTGDIEVPREQWNSFLESFSGQHEAWLTTVFVDPKRGEAAERDNCRLMAISQSADSKIDVVLDCNGEELKHTVTNPARLVFKRDEQGAHEGLEITTTDDTVVTLRFRAAAKPELLDGVFTSKDESPSIARTVHIRLGPTELDGDLAVPAGAKAVVLFAHGSGSSRFSPRNRHVAEALQQAGLGTLLLDLLTRQEEEIDAYTGELRFNIALLGVRLIGATRWMKEQPALQRLNVGYFGASTGAAAALVAAAELRNVVGAVVSRGGRPDLAGESLRHVTAPTLLIVGSRDDVVLALNKAALAELRGEKRLVVVEGATHLFEEPGALERVAQLARDWFLGHLVDMTASRNAA